MSEKLSVYYNLQYVSGEVAAVDDGQDTISVFKMYKKPVTGTLSATIYRGETAVQTFHSKFSTDEFILTDIADPDVKVVGVEVKGNEIVLTWNGVPGANHIVANYEYNMECEWDDDLKVHVYPCPELGLGNLDMY